MHSDRVRRSVRNTTSLGFRASSRGRPGGPSTRSPDTRGKPDGLSLRVSPPGDPCEHGPMFAIALALGSSACWGVADFVGGLQARRLPVSRVVLASQAIGLAFVIVALAIRATGPP